MKEFTHYNEPYGTVHFTVEKVEKVKGTKGYMKVRQDNGWVRVSGTVTKGSETSRLFHATSTKDLAGEPYSLEMPPESLEQGWRRTIAM